jgi:hypothetical protein
MGIGEFSDVETRLETATGEFTRPITREVLEGADIVITMGRGVGTVEIPDGPRCF